MHMLKNLQRCRKCIPGGKNNNPLSGRFHLRQLVKTNWGKKKLLFKNPNFLQFFDCDVLM